MYSVMLCIANAILYGMKVNIATAIIGMVKKTPGVADWSDECPQYEPLEIVDIDGPFDWSSSQQGLVISMYFAGYLVGMFPAGYLADR